MVNLDFTNSLCGTTLRTRELRLFYHLQMKIAPKTQILNSNYFTNMYAIKPERKVLSALYHTFMINENNLKTKAVELDKVS